MLSKEQIFDIAYQIPGQTWPLELDWIYNTLKDRPGTTHLEVGSYCGRSLWVAAAALQRGAIISVDDFSEGADEFWITGVFHATVNAIKRHFPQVSVATIRKNSVDARLNFTRKVDSIFIDACHHYAECKADIEGWSHFLSDDGVMFGHDYWARHPGVMDAVHEATLGEFAVIPRTRIWVKS